MDDTVTATIEEARRLLGEGHDKRAAELLAIAAGECRDSSKAATIKTLAEQGRDRAGLFGKRRWDEAIRLCDEQMTAASPSSGG